MNQESLLVYDRERQENNHQVFLVGAQGKVRERLQKMKLLNLLPLDNCFNERIFALQKAIAWVEMPEIKPLEPKSVSPDSSIN